MLRFSQKLLHLQLHPVSVFCNFMFTNFRLWHQKKKNPIFIKLYFNVLSYFPSMHDVVQRVSFCRQSTPPSQKKRSWFCSRVNLWLLVEVLKTHNLHNRRQFTTDRSTHSPNSSASTSICIFRNEHKYTENTVKLKTLEKKKHLQ